MLTMLTMLTQLALETSLAECALVSYAGSTKPAGFQAPVAQHGLDLRRELGVDIALLASIA
jgi:hypothetical protein